MKKRRLRPDDLAVDSFPVAPGDDDRGTVHGEQGTHISCCTCNAPTCDYSCPYSCPQTCYGGTCEFTCQESCGGTCFQSRCVDSCLCH